MHIIDTVHKGKVLIVDEIEASLHENIDCNILKLFLVTLMTQIVKNHFNKSENFKRYITSIVNKIIGLHLFLDISKTEVSTSCDKGVIKKYYEFKEREK